MSSSPGWVLGYVPPPAEWNTLFGNKADESEMAAKANTAGTTTNDNAGVGNVGEFISSNVVSGAALALSTGVVATVTSILLTAGDWDVWGDVGLIIAGTTSVTDYRGGINTVSATMPADAGGGAAFISLLPVAFVAGSPTNITTPVGAVRVSIGVTTTVFLVTRATFTVAACSAFGFIGARRRR